MVFATFRLVTVHFAWNLPRLGIATSHLQGICTSNIRWFLESFFRLSFSVSFRVSCRVSLEFHLGFHSECHWVVVRVCFGFYLRVSYQDFLSGFSNVHVGFLEAS